MSNQTYSNQQTDYWARASLADNVAQLEETRAVISLSEPEQYQVALWDDPGTGTYPLSDNAGATLTSQVKIVPEGDITNVNSVSLTPTITNPGALSTVWVNSNNSQLYLGDNPLAIGGAGGDEIYGFQLESTFNDTVDPSPFVKNISVSGDGNYICMSYSTTDTAFIYVRGVDGLFTLQQELTGLISISVTDLDAYGDRIVVSGVPSYIFKRTGTSWALEATLSDTLAQYDCKMNNTGDIAFIADSSFDSNAKLLIYQRVGTTWSLSQTILPDIIPPTIEIGYVLSITPSGDKVVYTNNYETITRLGDGTLSIYRQDTLNNWVLEQKISADAPDADYWGLGTNSVAINDSGDEIIAWVDPSNVHKLIRFNLIDGTWVQTQLTPIPDGRQFWRGYFIDKYYITQATLFSFPNMLFIFNKDDIDGDYYFYNRGKDYPGSTNYAVAVDSKTVVMSQSGGLDVDVYKTIGISNNMPPFSILNNSIPVISFDNADDKIYSDSGVTINNKLITADGLDLTTAAANPGTANTIWQQTSDGHLFRGSVDLEAGGGGDVVGPVSSTDNALVRFDTTTGKLLQDGSVTQTDTGFLQNIEAMDIITSATNPGNTNTLWRSTADGHLYRGTVDLEATGVVAPVVTVPNLLPVFDSTDGTLIKDSGIRLEASTRGYSMGIGTHPGLTTAADNYLQGYLTFTDISSGIENICWGTQILDGTTPGTSSQNVIIGNYNCVNGNFGNLRNVILGNRCATGASSMTDCTIVGHASGTGASNNVNCLYIDNAGAAENNTVRIGSGHTACYLSGIQNVAEPAVNNARPVAVGTDGQLTRYVLPMAELSFSDFTSPIAVPIALINTAYELALAGLSFTTNKAEKFNTSAAGRIQWTGSYTILVHFAMSFSMQATVNNDVIQLEYRKNGLTLPGGQSQNKFGNLAYETFANHLLISMDPNDYVSVFVTNTTGASDINIGNFNLFGMAH